MIDEEASRQISVIIPTYNRPDSLKRLLGSLGHQHFPTGKWEVIVVDDGSTISYEPLMREEIIKGVRYFKQENQGEAIARNRGSHEGNGKLLVFLDDDMEVASGYLDAIWEEHRRFPKAILIGNMQTVVPEMAGVYAKIVTPGLQPENFGEVSFTSILGGVVSISKHDYQMIGGMHPVLYEKRGAWLDMDFAYRAHQAGFTFRRVEGAVVFHHDFVNQNLKTACQRAYKISRIAPSLFQCHPGLVDEIPMFRDMTPVVPKNDTDLIVIRKLFRKVSATQVVVIVIEELVNWLENHWSKPTLLRPLYRWITGAYIYRGFQAGLRRTQGG